MLSEGLVDRDGLSNIYEREFGEERCGCFWSGSRGLGIRRWKLIEIRRSCWLDDIPIDALEEGEGEVAEAADQHRGSRQGEARGLRDRRPRGHASR
jgi:hypothetical protein